MREREDESLREYVGLFEAELRVTEAVASLRTQQRLLPVLEPIRDHTLRLLSASLRDFTRLERERNRLLAGPELDERKLRISDRRGRSAP